MKYSIEELEGSFRLLIDDVVQAQKYMLAHKTPYSRRAYIRAAFALIEGFTFMVKQFTLRFGEDRNIDFSAAEITLLKEESYDLDKKGIPVTRSKFLRLAENFRFAASCFSRVSDSNFILDVGGEGWKCFREAIKIRHRITHPKTERDVDISEEDIEIIQKGMEWFRINTINLMKAHKTMPILK